MLKLKKPTEEQRIARFERQKIIANEVEAELSLNTPGRFDRTDIANAHLLVQVAVFTLAGQLTKSIALDWIGPMVPDSRQLALSIMRREYSNPAAAKYLDHAQTANQYKNKQFAKSIRRLNGFY